MEHMKPRILWLVVVLHTCFKLGCVMDTPEEAVSRRAHPIVSGSSVEECGWPTTVFVDGCTATLIHERAISTAQHCGTPSTAMFCESMGGPSRSIPILGCVGEGSMDAQICELGEPVTQLPVTPVLFGCEIDRYMVVGQPVVIAGFGETAYGVGGGIKYWADQTITGVEPERTIIGDGGDGTSPCRGDSGGPVFLQVDDGSWRVFGTVFQGTTGLPCNSAANFQRIDLVVPHFERERGVDITPCFDGSTGAWEPGSDCGGFFAGDHTGHGGWSDWCSGTPACGYSSQCGPAYDSGSDGDADSDGDGDIDADGDGDGDTDGDGDADGDGDTDSDGDSDADTDGDADSDAGVDGGVVLDTGENGGCQCTLANDGGPSLRGGVLFAFVSTLIS